MKHSCRYLLVFGIVYTLGIWGSSYYYFDSQVKKMEALFDLANEARQTGKNDMIYLHQAADLLGKGFYRNNWKAATVCLGMGTYYLDMKQYDQAIPWLKMDEKLNNKKPFQYMEIRTFENLGYAYWKTHAFEKAEYYLQKTRTAISKYDLSNYTDLDEGLFYHRFGIVKYQNQKYQEALVLFQISRDNLYYCLIKSSTRNNLTEHQKLSELLGNIALQTALCHVELNQLTDALDYVKLAEDHFSESKNFESFAPGLYTLLAKIYEKTGDLQQAKSVLSSAKQYIDYMNFPTANAYNELIDKLNIN